MKTETRIYYIIFYIASTVWAWQVIKGSEWLPWYFGGDGDHALAGANLPFYQSTKELAVYGYFCFGFRIYGLVNIIFFAEREGDFAEMLLHEMVTAIIYFQYLSSNFLPIGTMISFLHDMTDIPATMSKGAWTTTWWKISAPLFIFNQITWFFFRLYCFPMLIFDLYNYYDFTSERS